MPRSIAMMGFLCFIEKTTIVTHIESITPDLNVQWILWIKISTDYYSMQFFASFQVTEKIVRFILVWKISPELFDIFVVG